MSWFNVWDGLKNKTCRYLLQRYLGQFLEEQLNIEQLKVELYNGKATIRNVSLKVEAINELLEAQGWAVEIIEGHIGLLSVSVPWNALMTKNSSIEVSDVTISLRPIKRKHNGTSMLESMWSSASSSMQLAEECMKQHEEEDGTSDIHTSAIIGLEKFAETIDNVLNRIKAKFSNTTVKLEYPSLDGTRGIALVLFIQDVNYKNETGTEQPEFEKNEKADFPISLEEMNQIPTFAKHNIALNGFRLYSEEFKIFKGNRSVPREVFIKRRTNYFTGTKRIQILEIKNQQNITIKMKQSEEINGPKVYLDLEIGSIFTFVSPRQIHLLIKFQEAFSQEKQSSEYKQKNKSELNTPGVKQPYSNHNLVYKSNMSGILSKHGNWGDDIEQAIFKPGLSEHMHCEKFVEKSTSLCDSFTSSMSSSNMSNKKYNFKVTNLESSGEILKFNIRMATFTAVILHEDILVENSSTSSLNLLNENSEVDMLNAADQFFSSLQIITHENICQPSNRFCKKNHLYLFISPVFAEGNQNRKTNILCMNFILTAPKIELFEILDDKPTPLLYFYRHEVSSDGTFQQDLILAFKSSSSQKLKEDVLTTFDITLAKCAMELDISIYDRLSGTLSSSPFDGFYPNGFCSKTAEKNIHHSHEIKLTSEALDLKLRFPITDARPIFERIPWWKQNVRSDFLLLTFSHLSLKQALNKMDLIANKIDIFYYDDDLKSQIHLLTACGLKPENQSFSSNMEYPKITVGFSEELKAFVDNNADSRGFGINESSNCRFNIPFSTKRVCRQSETLHNISDCTEPEFVLLPEESEEIKQFCEHTMNLSNTQIKICLPIAVIVLTSKQLYEKLYNRLNLDVFMWEPSSPLYKNAKKQNSELPMKSTQYFETSLLGTQASKDDKKNIKNNRKNTKSDTVPIESLNSVTSLNCDANDYFYHINNSNSIYFSAYDNKHHNKEKQTEIFQQSQFSIDILIKQGSLICFVPVRNSKNNVIPGQQGKFIFKIRNLAIFSVSGFNADVNLGCICLQLSDMELYHCGLVPGNSEKNSFEFDRIEDYMQSTFYMVPLGLRKGSGTINKKREMVTIVIEVKKKTEQQIKRLRIAAGIQNLALRHNKTLFSNNWLNQLTDFLDISEYPIDGFKPFEVITEIQIHMWDSAIDYRPRNFPYRAVIEISSFSICSNFISSIKSCNFRFIVDDCVLSLGPYDCLENNTPNNKVTCIKSENLVPVLSIGLFDISLRLSDVASENCSKFDIRSSLHDVHLRTCSDSGSALIQLILHIAHNDEDTYLPKGSSPQSSVYTDADLSRLKQERVNLMMAEAVGETVTSSEMLMHKKPNDHGIEVFYFPDENDKKKNVENLIDEEIETVSENEICDIFDFETNVMQTSYYKKSDNKQTLPQVTEDLGDINTVLLYKPDTNSRFTQDDEYCIIPNEDKPFMSNCGIQNVEVCDDPLRIVDNHFHIPSGKPDLLRSPAGFPIAELRYTLCEMTFTWHLYGGQDFQEKITKENQIKRDTFKMSEEYKYGVSFSKGAQGVHFNKKPKEKLTWKSLGGLQRNNEVLVEMQFSKIRFSHEEYPTDATQSSRQVLLVGEIEIRDRVQSSDIKKFLYHSYTKNLSNKSPHHMVVIKALHVRPNPKVKTDEECSLRISLLPMRLHIDQDTLLFLAEFFSNISSKCCSGNLQYESGLSSCENVPVMNVDEMPDNTHEIGVRNQISNNLDFLLDEGNCSSGNKTVLDGMRPIFFREIIFSPEVCIRFDYHGRRIELSRGPIAGLLMGLGQLQCSEIRLRKLVYRRGILGLDKLITYVCKEWLKDIKRNQLPHILSGVGPAQAFVQLFQGIYDLVWLPIEQYQKDGRLIRGFQLGAQSFSARTALAALEITSRLIQLLQFTAETAFDMVSPGPSIRSSRKMPKGKKKRPYRPKDVREGVTNAYLIVKEGINDSANSLIERAVEEHDQKGYTGAVGAVMRQIPQLVVCPAVLATQATTNILGGVKSSLIPEAKIEAREKWKSDSD